MYVIVLLCGCLLGCTGVWGQHDHHMNKDEKKVMLGEKVVLPCKVFKPDESATVHWFYLPTGGEENLQTILTAGPKGIIIEESELKSRVSLKNNSKLAIDKLQVQDNKQFLCRVVFSNGVTKESKVQLSVYETPSVPELRMEQNGIPVTDTAVQIGTCESKSGFPKPLIKWYKDHRPLRHEKDGVDIKVQYITESTGLITVKSILYAPVHKSDASASFHCDVSYSSPKGDYMQESEKKSIIVHYPTTSVRVYFTSSSEKIKEGDTVELFCEGDGNPQPTYTLQKDGSDDILSEDEPYAWQVSRADAGIYVCKSLDLDSGLDLNNDTTLFVHFLDPPELSLGSPVTVNLQSKLMVSCHVNASTPAVIHWKQDGKTIANGSVLSLDSVDYSDTGLYTCVADLRDVPELSTSTDINVTVQGSPQVSVNSQVIEVQDGETVTASCIAVGYPLPQITWYINGTKVEAQAVDYNSKDYEVTSELTFLVNTGFINQSLTCMAINKFNSSIAYIQLLEKSMTTPSLITIFETTTTPLVISSESPTTTTIDDDDDDDSSIAGPGTRAPEAETISQKSYGIVIVIVIICILVLAFLGAVLYFLYKKGHIPCGRSGKKEITSPGTKDKIIVEMKPESPAEESVLLTGSQEKPSDQEKYIDLRN